MNSTRQQKLPFVIFQFKEGLYGVASQNVLEIVMMPQATSVPNTPPEVRGVAVVLSRGTDLLAFSADLVEAAEHIPDEDIEPMPPALSGLNAGHHCRVGRRPKTNQTILLLDDEFFACSTAAN